MSTTSTPPLSGTAGALWRNTVRFFRNRASLMSAFIMPGLFMGAFLIVFGHAASQTGLDYALFLLPAAMFQAAMFSAVDSESGILARLRSMPTSALAIRLGTDLIRTVASLATVSVLALVCGAKPHSFGALALAFLVAAAISEILSMFFGGISLRAKHPVSASGVIQSLKVLVLMLSTAFIPVGTLPHWLQPIVRHQPLSPCVDTMRNILTGKPLGSTGWEALAWLAIGLGIGAIWVTRSLRRSK
ncbi:MAG: ABC transporter permease [Bifidobacterium tibiigranuli]|jgi:ABC-2 type transport system permease protein|nr:ABC transporter permease [Bifidobacterium tibiigranuli]MCI1797694.1 ABC transporter permease [Bifidobacterium tibiigranuli]